MSLPFDIVSIVTKHLPYAEIPRAARLLCRGIQDEDVKKLVTQKRDSYGFFEDIISQVPDLMVLMKATNTCLVGKRAFSYFHGIKVADIYPWQFMCPNSASCWATFIGHLEEKGVDWSPIRDSGSMGDNHRSIEGSLYSNSKIVTISLNWNMRGSIMCPMTEFETTALQCVITADKAFDPYGKLHAQGKYRLWKKKLPKRTTNVLPSTIEAMNFCDTISMQPISFDEHRQPDPHKQFEPLQRNFSDSECLVAEFKQVDETKLRPKKGFSFVQTDADTYSRYYFEEDAHELHCMELRNSKGCNTELVRPIWGTLECSTINEVFEFIKYIPNYSPYKATQVSRGMVEFMKPDWADNTQWAEILYSIYMIQLIP